jgi:hypothetical protein
MARRGQDVIGFTRIFVLFCTLVLVPALFLSGFGVIAILNERQAERQRRADIAQGVLGRAATFAEVLDAADHAARAAMDASDVAALLEEAAAVHPIGAWVALSREGVVLGHCAAARRQAVVAHVARIALRAEAGRPAHHHRRRDAVGRDLAAAGGRRPRHRVRRRRRQARRRAARALHARVHHRRALPAAATIPSLERRSASSSSCATTTGPRPEEIVTRTLQPPFDRYTLVVAAPHARVHHDDRLHRAAGESSWPRSSPASSSRRASSSGDAHLRLKTT